MENLKVKNYENGITEMLVEDENGIKQGKYFKYENGRIKEEGNFKDDKKDGKWIYYMIEQNRCLLQKEANYKDGKLHGEYKEFHLYGGVKEEGQYVAGQKEGEWKTYYSNGQIMKEANYKEGILDGSYKECWEYGGLKEKGQYVEGQKEGNWRTEDGHSWENISYKNDKRHGIYERLLDGREKGFLFTKGEYVDGLKEGEWITKDEDNYKKIFENYKNGLKDKLDKIETRYDTSFGQLNENGQKEGEWTLIAKDKSYKIIANYKDGQLDGKTQHFSKDGQLTEEGEYKGNKEVGEWKFYKNNKLSEQRIYHADSILSKYDYKEYYENGNLKEEGTRDSILYDGVIKKWYENGQLKMEANYVDGRKEGNYKEWYENGQLKCEGNYSDGEKIGTWKEYDNVKEENNNKEENNEKISEKNFLFEDKINDESKKSQEEATTNKGFFNSIKNLFNKETDIVEKPKEQEKEGRAVRGRTTRGRGGNER